MGERPLWLLLEDVFIIASIAALWPSILGWEGWVWEAVKYGAVIGLIWIFIRRMKRYQVRKDSEADDKLKDDISHR